ncbi:hypothetical protein ALC62_09196 [Cyphomyrmex costatus]|uniref:Endonuclease/exonuclease/phosphatase domain-containing protein n=1 Tax=Cyphomyrmex costatus TaxID=456900 RepID=A0A151IFX3_9HYME|nr:hypothetical protein ALC62_09196 [Cyphomyrmex costatus]
MAHKEELQHQIMKKINPACMALSETRLTEEIEDSEVSVPGYNMIRCDAENRNTGGVVLYVRDDIKYDLVLVKKLESNCWCAAIEMKDEIYKGVLMVVYHSPSASDGEFVRFLENIVEQMTVKEECIIIGDFNIDFMIDSFYMKKLQIIMQSLGMKQYVYEPTRITKDSRTIIDLIFANKEVKVQVQHEPKITDHAWLKIELKGNSIVDSLDVTAPRKKCKIPKIWEGKKWFSEEIREAAVRRDAAYRKALYENTDQNWIQFKVERNAVVTLIRKKKKEYYESMIDFNRDDPAAMWKTLKEIVRDVNKFEDIGEGLIYINENQEIFENFDMIKIDYLEEIIMGLSRRKGTEEGISSDILKAAFYVIQEEFVNIINTSLREGCFPESWKTSTII